MWLAGRVVCNSRARPASKLLREREFSIVPATGLHSESSRLSQASLPKGTFKARTSKGIFSQFFVFRIGMRRKWRFTDRKAILLRVRAPDAALPLKAVVIPNGFIVRNLLLAGSSPARAPQTFPMWKSSGNSVDSAN